MTEKTVKAANYTAEQTAAIIADYKAGISIETIAASVGKTTRSVIAKLSREGAYKAKEYTTKQGEKPVKKDELASRLMELANLTEAEADSLSKANKTALSKIIELISPAVIIEVEPEAADPVIEVEPEAA